ncbi:uncharacterized protein LOC134244365 [Saccostrea cucullata]|uniref:uncharacterized protein LOC134244365 n=1 Tax=Saccostrea cuccullata TaxID=36930 RepID=UPI002ED4D402
MPFTVDVKAKIFDLEAFKEKVKVKSQSEGEVLVQEDIFFNVPQGRLKLRNTENKRSELCFYERPDQEEGKLSDFATSFISDPEGLKETLKRALGIKGILKKVRNYFQIGQTRIHVDQVEGLGNFMELEVELREGQSLEEGQEVAMALMEELGVPSDHLISVAYIDLLLQKQTYLKKESTSS